MRILARDFHFISSHHNALFASLSSMFFTSLSSFSSAASFLYSVISSSFFFAAFEFRSSHIFLSF